MCYSLSVMSFTVKNGRIFPLRCDDLENLFIIVGLGNPGTRYESTRHNVGFETVDVLSRQYGISVVKLKHKAYIGEGQINGSRVVLVKPQTFMNLSGESVRDVLEWYKAQSGNVIVVYDDVDLQLGSIRVRPKGSAGTHNGMRSILYQIRTDNFPRVRIGIGKPPEGWEIADYVLGKFTGEEKVVIGNSIKKAADAVAMIIESGTEAAMNKFNG